MACGTEIVPGYKEFNKRANEVAKDPALDMKMNQLITSTESNQNKNNKLPKPFKDKYGLTDIKYIEVSKLPERGIGMEKNKYNQMKSSIENKGVQTPVLIDRDSNQVIDGLRRIFIAQTIKDETGSDVKVPVVYLKQGITRKEIPEIQEFLKARLRT